MIKHVSNKIQNAIQMELFKAKESIKIAVAWFTNELLLQPLIMKLQMGVSVEIVLNDDEINRGGDTSLDFTDFLQAGGVLRWNDSKQLMHEKFCIIDDRIIITGSYNWTNKAELNSEVENFFYDEEETTKFYNELFIKLSVRFKQEPRAARNLEDKRRFFVEEYKRTMVRFKRIKRIANNKIKKIKGVSLVKRAFILMNKERNIVMT